MSREIHAFQNEDGTYRATVLRKDTRVEVIDHVSHEVTTEGSLEIPRCSLFVKIHSPDSQDVPINTLVFQIDDESK